MNYLLRFCNLIVHFLEIKRIKAEKKRQKREAKKEKERLAKLQKASEPREPTTIFASGFPKDAQKHDLISFFEQRGALKLNRDGII